MSDDSEKREHRRRVRRWYDGLLREMPPNFTPVEAVVCVEALDSAGELCLFTAKTAGLSAWRAYGMVSFALDDFSPANLAVPTEDDE